MLGAAARMRMSARPALRATSPAFRLSQTSVRRSAPLVRAVEGQRNPKQKPQLLAPAGGWPQLKAAVASGADAVYFGLTELNARARASNFAPSEIHDVVAYLHERGVKGFVTINVLVFDDELPLLEKRIRLLAEAGVDAVIVQDLGALALIRKVAPHLPVHGSTQMSITSGEGAEFARERGVKRVVVGRELSVQDIQSVHEGTSAEVEAFVHGALCVSYSGQCFSSEAWGGRSANRGQCAQACRMPYGLLVDGELRVMGDEKYLLSPQDLAALDMVPQLIEAGVSCFKIEGRLKGPEYVALTTRLYREAIDAAFAADDDDDDDEQKPFATSQQDWDDLHQVFARGQDATHRGLTPGFLEGSKHQRLVRGRAPRHRGVFVGEVTAVTKRGVRVWLSGGGSGAMPSVAPGDGVVFDAGQPEQDEDGGSVFEVIDHGTHDGEDREVELRFGKGWIDLQNLHEGMLVWRTRDAKLERRIRASYDGVDKRAGVVCEVRAGTVGEPLTITLRDQDGRKGVGISDVMLQHAESRPLDEAAVQRAIGELGGTPLCIERSDVRIASGLFLPAKGIKVARRSAVDALLAARREHTRASDMPDGKVLSALKTRIAEEGLPRRDHGDDDVRSASSKTMPKLTVLCRTRQQAEAAVACDVDEIILDFLEVHGLREATEAVQAAGKRAVVATPRILKPSEERLWAFYLRLEADALLVRSAGMLYRLRLLGGAGATVSDGPAKGCKVPPLHGDFSLNAANTLAAHDLLETGGLERLCLTHDLNAKQQVELAKELGVRAELLEVIVHTHLPIFHTEHCVFARFLSDGDSYVDCGHPCESAQVHLRSHDGQDHRVMADMGCRNTVFNAAAQSGACYVSELAASGFGRFRIELVDESADRAREVVQGYQSLLRGDITGEQLMRRLDLIPDANGAVQGVGLGSLEVRAERDRSELSKTNAKWAKMDE